MHTLTRQNKDGQFQRLSELVIYHSDGVLYIMIYRCRAQRQRRHLTFVDKLYAPVSPILTMQSLFTLSILPSTVIGIPDVICLSDPENRLNIATALYVTKLYVYGACCG